MNGPSEQLKPKTDSPFSEKDQETILRFFSDTALGRQIAERLKIETPTGALSAAHEKTPSTDPRKGRFEDRVDETTAAALTAASSQDLALSFPDLGEQLRRAVPGGEEE